METIEHLEDYKTLLSNAVHLLDNDGVLVVGTPNRVMTYNRYPGRRHMDPSHVQEFTPYSLRYALEPFFEEIDLYLQFLDNYWETTHSLASVTSSSSRFRSMAKEWVPPILAGAIKSWIRRRADAAFTSRRQRFDESRVRFIAESDSRDLVLDAFALMAVCRKPIRI